MPAKIWRKWFSHTSQWECKMVQATLWRSVWQFLKNPNYHMTQQLCFWVFPREMKTRVHRKTRRAQFTAAVPLSWLKPWWLVWWEASPGSPCLWPSAGSCPKMYQRTTCNVLCRLANGPQVPGPCQNLQTTQMSFNRSIVKLWYIQFWVDVKGIITLGEKSQSQKVTCSMTLFL